MCAVFLHSCTIQTCNGHVLGRRSAAALMFGCFVVCCLFAAALIRCTPSQGSGPLPADDRNPALTPSEATTASSARQRLFGRQPPTVSVLNLLEALRAMGDEKEREGPSAEIITAASQAAKAYPQHIPHPPLSSQSAALVLMMNPMQSAHGVSFRELFHHLTHYPSQIDRTELQSMFVFVMSSANRSE